MEDKDIEVLEEKKKDEKHGSTFGVVFIALLLVGLSVACGWFANSYFNNLNKKPDETNNTEKIDEKIAEKEKTYTVTEEEAFRLFNTFLKGNIYSGIPVGGISLESFQGKSLITIDDLNNDMKFNIIQYALNEEDIITLNTDGGQSNMGQIEIPVESLNKYSLLYFNKIINYPSTFGHSLSYCVLKNSSYICDYFPGGGTLEGGWIYEPITYNVENNILSIDAIAVYFNGEGYSKDKNSSKYYCENVKSEDIKKCLKDNAQYFNKVSMKFDLSNDKYLFISIEK